MPLKSTFPFGISELRTLYDPHFHFSAEKRTCVENFGVILQLRNESTVGTPDSSAGGLLVDSDVAFSQFIQDNVRQQTHLLIRPQRFPPTTIASCWCWWWVGGNQQWFHSGRHYTFDAFVQVFSLIDWIHSLLMSVDQKMVLQNTSRSKV